ncbi:aminotransferase class I/II-fold pyridoxal phosphate-dependent enzyme [Candidatus Microgenomates bacterium]|nr:MAG: aminotransferase class I/II-fold pyridoxal phosphate-dependent enzyme [Candidatus Microgenomates bacterium]
MFTRPVAIGLSPNTQADDYLAAFSIVLTPWRWQKGEYVAQVEQWFKREYKTDTAVAFNAGRSALLALLQAFGIGQGDEVLIQAFTCVAVPNSILWAGARPVFVDTDKTLNFSVKDAEKKLTTKTKAVIVQHTFGMPADLDAIKAFCKKHKLLLIEDCAHSLGAWYKNKQVGTIGDAAFFSFGRDKVISSVFGGVAIVANKQVGQRLRATQEACGNNSYLWVFQQIMHPVAMSVILPLYSIGIGKALLVVLQKLHLLSFPVYRLEKMTKKPAVFPRKLPNALGFLALAQLRKLHQLNKTRAKFAAFYQEKLRNGPDDLVEVREGAVFLRFPLLSSRAQELLFQMKKQGIIAGNWYRSVVDPKGVLLTKAGYEPGSCPEAEKAAELIINLPTYPTLTQEQARNIVQIILKNQELRSA